MSQFIGLMNKKDIPILMYHDISENGDEWSVSPREFEEQLTYLISQGYTFITIEDLYNSKENSELKKSVAITFDDGYAGVYTWGVKLLSKYNAKGTAYILTDYVGKPNFLSWEQIKEISQQISIQSHGRLHRNLVKLDNVALDNEIEGSRRIILERVGLRADHFSYPFGKYDLDVLNRVRKVYKSAVTADQTFSKKELLLGRIWVQSKTSLEEFSKLLKRPTLSFLILTKNNEKTISRSVESISELADEIIIVDNGSTDNTLDILKKYKMKVIQNTWKDDFSQARNKGIEEAESDWIFCLDADETISYLDGQGLLELIGKMNFDGFIFQTRNYTNDSSILGFISNKGEYKEEQGKGHIVSSKVRLFKNFKGYNFKGKVHELIDTSINEKGGIIAVTDIPVHHFGMMDLSIVSEKTRYYLQLEEKKIKEEPTVKSFFEMGIQFKNQGLYEKAEGFLQNAHELEPKNKLISLNLAFLKRKINKFDEAIALLQPFSVEEDEAVHYSLGLCYLKKNNLNEAKEEFLKAKNVNAHNPRTLSNLGVIYQKLGDYRESINHFLESLKRDSSDPKTFFNLGICYEEKGLLSDAIRAYSVAASLNHSKKEEIEAKISELKQLYSSPSKIEFTFGSKY